MTNRTKPLQSNALPGDWAPRIYRAPSCDRATVTSESRAATSLADSSALSAGSSKTVAIDGAPNRAESESLSRWADSLKFANGFLAVRRARCASAPVAVATKRQAMSILSGATELTGLGRGKGGESKKTTIPSADRLPLVASRPDLLASVNATAGAGLADLHGRQTVDHDHQSPPNPNRHVLRCRIFQPLDVV